jgi:hypothetical protein
MYEWALNNGRKQDRMIIDLMLAHLPIGISTTELQYDRAAFIDRRRELSDLQISMLSATLLQRVRCLKAEGSATLKISAQPPSRA